MKLLVTISAILFSIATYAQSTLFKVLTSQGTVDIVTNGSSAKVSSGARLNSGSTLKVGANAYLGLIHISGATMELKQAGEYDVTKLAQRFDTKQASYTDKYADYLVKKVTSNNESKKNYSYTGAVTRGAQNLVLWAPSDNAENIVKLLQGVPVELNWGEVDGVKKYKVTIKTFDETKVLFTKIITKSNVTLDLSAIKPTTDAPYFMVIQALDSKVANSIKPFYLLDKESSATVTTELNTLKNTVDTLQQSQKKEQVRLFTYIYLLYRKIS